MAVTDRHSAYGGDVAAGALQDLDPATGPRPGGEPGGNQGSRRRRATAGLSHAKLWLFASDALFVLLAMVLASGLERWSRSDSSVTHGGDTAALVCSFVAILAGLAQQRAYRVRYLALRRSEFARVVRGVAIGLAATIVLGFVFGFEVPTWLVWIFGTGSVLVCLNREIARRIFSRLRGGGRMVRRAVVVGANNEADELAVMLSGSRELGYDVVGRVETNQDNGEPMPWRTVLTQVERTVAESGAGNVIIAATATTLDTAGHLTRRLTDDGIHVEMCMPLPDIDTTRLQLRPLGRFPVFYVEPVDRSGWRPFAKRVFDVVLASLVLLIVSPILALAALAIKVDSRGPVVFRQTRVGKDGDKFSVLKLRTMIVDAEERLDELKDQNEATGPVFKIRNDPRITRVGRLLRKFSIDELPQFWNVIRGEMSIVGPRPALPDEMALWTTDLHERLRVRPGITGMWQVNGRTDTSGGDYVRLDLYYVDNWSLFIDLVIMGKTVPAVLSGRGAY
jgi:exopolysaccharide biosynthesis polyprenyl glycosylphosphotransferase